MLMQEVKYAYAKNKDNVYVSINDVHLNNRYEYYYLLSESLQELQMIPVINGERQKHFRTKSDGVSVGESPEHLNLKAFLCNSLEFYCKDIDEKITAKYAKDEYQLENNRIVDVAYFDDDNNFLCGIEVVHTNDIKYNKFKDLYQSDYIIFKVYTHAPQGFIFVNNRKIETETNKQVIRGFQEEIEISNRDGIGENEKLLYILKQKSRQLFKELYPLRNKHNIGLSYFDSLRQVKSELQKTKGEEGELIRDIEQITKQINQFYIIS
jgi:hypothetical protein